MNIWDWLRYWLWDRWHGVSISAYDVKRAQDQRNVGLRIGRLRIPRWVLIVIGIIVLVLLLSDLRLALPQQLLSGISLQGLFVQYWPVLAILLVFLIGFIAGWLMRDFLYMRNASKEK